MPKVSELSAAAREIVEGVRQWASDFNPALLSVLDESVELFGDEADILELGQQGLRRVVSEEYERQQEYEASREKENRERLFFEADYQIRNYLRDKGLRVYDEPAPGGKVLEGWEYESDAPKITIYIGYSQPEEAVTLAFDLDETSPEDALAEVRQYV